MSLRQRTLSIFASAFVSACSSSSEPPAAPVTPGAAAASTVPACEPAPLDTTVPFPLGGEASDVACALESLAPILSETQVICSAESSHGVAETAAIHLAVIRHAVLKLGYRIIAEEIDDATMRTTIDRYVNDGDDAALGRYAKAAGRTLANTKNYLGLFRGLRDLAAELPAGEHLSIRGMDVAITMGPARTEVLAYLAKVDASLVPMWTAKLNVKDSTEGQGNAQALRQLLDEHHQRYVALSDESSFANCASDTDALADGFGFLQSYASGDFTTGNAAYRDPAMARNILRLAAGGKVIVLAHLGHCARDYPSQGTTRAGGKFAFGKVVHESFGDRYKIVGQLLGGGEEMLPSGKTGAVAPDDDTVEHALSTSVEVPFALVPIRGMSPIDFDHPWTLSRMPEERVLPSAQADAIAFIKTAMPVTLNW